MRAYTILLIVLLCTCITPRITQGEEKPILNVFVYSDPQETPSGKQITYTSNIFSTSETVETMHIYAISKPWVRFDIAGVVQDGTLGAVSCQPTLAYLDCTVPIKVGYPATIFAQLEAPLLDTCYPYIGLFVVADLPNRHTEASASTHLLDATTCTYLPIISVSDNPQ